MLRLTKRLEACDFYIMKHMVKLYWWLTKRGCSSRWFWPYCRRKTTFIFLCRYSVCIYVHFPWFSNRGENRTLRWQKGPFFFLEQKKVHCWSLEGVNLWLSVLPQELCPTELFCVRFVICKLVDLDLVLPVQLKLWGSTGRRSRWARVLNQHQ